MLFLGGHFYHRHNKIKILLSQQNTYIHTYTHAHIHTHSCTHTHRHKKRILEILFIKKVTRKKHVKEEVINALVSQFYPRKAEKNATI